MYYSIQLLHQIPTVIKQSMPYDDPYLVLSIHQVQIMGNEFGIFLKGPRDSYLKIGYPRPAGGRLRKKKKKQAADIHVDFGI